MVIGAHAADANSVRGATGFRNVGAGWKAGIADMTPGEMGHPELSPRDVTVFLEVAAKDVATVPGEDSVMMQPYFRFWKNAHLLGGT
jgi:hypothetical protein